MKYFLLGLLFAAFFGGVIAIGVRDCNAREACETNGGRVERYNYRWVYCGRGCMSRVSDWRCVK